MKNGETFIDFGNKRVELPAEIVSFVELDDRVVVVYFDDKFPDDSIDASQNMLCFSKDGTLLWRAPPSPYISTNSEGKRVNWGYAEIHLTNAGKLKAWAWAIAMEVDPDTGEYEVTFVDPRG